jgi:hypothetical protein
MSIRVEQLVERAVHEGHVQVSEIDELAGSLTDEEVAGLYEQLEITPGVALTPRKCRRSRLSSARGDPPCSPSATDRESPP